MKPKLLRLIFSMTVLLLAMEMIYSGMKRGI